jgi:hypothetical protein
MKKILSLFVLLFCFTFTYAKQVNEQTAKTVGLNFINNKTNCGTLQGNPVLSLVYKSQSKSATDPSVYFYVFNINTNKGFVIVSADDIVLPILGYSDEGGFNPAKIPDVVQDWLDGDKNQIAYAIEHNLDGTQKIKDKWMDLEGQIAYKTNPMSKTGISPLLKTKWDQSPYYNDKCPYDNTKSERTVTGCVATAMAQVMKYWNYPKKGSSFHSYSDANYGSQSADFANTTYSWSAMPNQVTVTDTNVSKLMYHCGVSVDMNYGIGSTGGSSAYVVSAASPKTNCAEYALKNYFNYSNKLQGLERKNYSDSKWISILEAEFDSTRPSIYAGFGSGGGHCFVADGYDINDLIHYNWGWSGYYNGYFEIDSLNPGGTGTGGGSGGYNNDQQAIIGIKAPTGVAAATYDLELYKSVNTGYSSYAYGDSIVVTTNIANYGTNNFTGDYGAAIFDKSNSFITFIEILKGKSLSAGKVYTNDLTFKDTSTFGILPGSYTIYMYYRPTGGNWSQLINHYSYDYDYASIKVMHSNDLETDSDITLSSNPLISGKANTVYTNILNSGSSTFKGTYYIALFNLDGTFAAIIDSVSSQTLPATYHYTHDLKFAITNLKLNPGSYLLALMYRWDVNSYWELAGSTNHLNPIIVTVQQPALNPDKYENDDSVLAAYKLPVSFSSNTATVNTAGSNIHNGSDYDFYKVVLPSGYDYTFTGRLQDANSNNNGGTYTVDAIFSHSEDAGKSWSNVYDDVMSGSYTLKNGGTTYLWVAPSFTGYTGTYELDMRISRSVTSGVNEDINKDENISIYPNPAHSLFNVDLSALIEKTNIISLVNMQGQQILNINPIPGSNSVQIPVNNIAKGVYILRVQTESRVITKEIIIN